MSGDGRRSQRTADDRRSALDRGHRAEAWAAGELEAMGWCVLERNARAGNGEIDLVIRREGCVRFVEVKGRTAVEDGWSAVTPWKQGKLRRAAEMWLQLHPDVAYDEVAFMVAVVTFGEPWKLELLDDAF